MDMLGIIKQLCENMALRWTAHVLVRLTQRGITTDDVVFALLNGDIIEAYPTDYPYPSCLVLGQSVNGNPLHVVCGKGEGELWLITAYEPSLREWEQDFRTRRKS
ncbi:MAG: DUF4258 domain-containing protein [Defluviitaleaceae bacterium]|nr:DUF4258 domain-containing protein [Defluviitaleaceae bacterium]